MSRSWMEVLGNAAKLLGERAQQRTASFEQVVRDAADGKRIDPAALADLLEASDKTAEDFAANVELLLTRRDWSALSSQEPEWEERRQRLQTDLAAAKQTFETDMARLRSAYSAEMDRVSAEADSVQRKLDSCRTARNKLLESSGQFGTLLQLQGQAAMPIREIEQSLSRTQAKLVASRDSVREELRRAKRQDEINELGDRLRHLEFQLQEVGAQIDAKRKESEAVRSEISELEREMSQVS